jgi:hypothetical protein
MRRPSTNNNSASGAPSERGLAAPVGEGELLGFDHDVDGVSRRNAIAARSKHSRIFNSSSNTKPVELGGASRTVKPR